MRIKEKSVEALTAAGASTNNPIKSLANCYTIATLALSAFRFRHTNLVSLPHTWDYRWGRGRGGYPG